MSSWYPAGRWERRLEGLGWSGDLFPLKSVGIAACFGCRGKYCEALTLRLPREAESWAGNLSGISPDDRFHPKMKDMGS